MALEAAQEFHGRPLNGPQTRQKRGSRETELEGEGDGGSGMSREGRGGTRSPQLSAPVLQLVLLEGSWDRETEDPPSAGDPTVPHVQV